MGEGHFGIGETRSGEPVEVFLAGQRTGDAAHVTAAFGTIGKCQAVPTSGGPPHRLPTTIPAIEVRWRRADELAYLKDDRTNRLMYENHVQGREVNDTLDAVERWLERCFTAVAEEIGDTTSPVDTSAR
jgi:hypothetical protein